MEGKKEERTDTHTLNRKRVSAWSWRRISPVLKQGCGLVPPRSRKRASPPPYKLIDCLNYWIFFGLFKVCIRFFFILGIYSISSFPLNVAGSVSFFIENLLHIVQSVWHLKNNFWWMQPVTWSSSFEQKTVTIFALLLKFSKIIVHWYLKNCCILIISRLLLSQRMFCGINI